MHGEYEAQSPTLGRPVRYTDDEVLSEVDRMVAEARGTGWSAGRTIYRQIPFCVNPGRLWHPDSARLLEDWRLCKTLGVPPAATLDEVPALYADAAMVIEHELAHIRRAGGENG